MELPALGVWWLGSGWAWAKCPGEEAGGGAPRIPMHHWRWAPQGGHTPLAGAAPGAPTHKAVVQAESLGPIQAAAAAAQPLAAPSAVQTPAQMPAKEAPVAPQTERHPLPHPRGTAHTRPKPEAEFCLRVGEGVQGGGGGRPLEALSC